MKMLRWGEWTGHGLQHVELGDEHGWFTADAVVIASDPAMFGATFRIVADEAWLVRRVEVTVSGGPSVLLESDGRGNWERDGQPVAHLAGALEPDISATPLTNSFPVRRLRLGKGESAEIRTAYVELPSLDLFADGQRYTCLEEGRRYLYESLDSDFRAELAFDASGFVMDYPGLFRRLA